MRRIKKSSIAWTVVTIGIFILLNYLIQFRILRPAQQISLYGIGINIILAVSLNMILGLSGQFSLGMLDLCRLGHTPWGCVLRPLILFGDLDSGFLWGFFFQ